MTKIPNQQVGFGIVISVFGIVCDLCIVICNLRGI